MAVTEVARKHGISAATFYQWRSKYGGMSVSDMQRLRELEQENAPLKRMYADLSLDRSVLKNYSQKNSDAHAAPRSGGMGNEKSATQSTSRVSAAGAASWHPAAGTERSTRGRRRGSALG